MNLNHLLFLGGLDTKTALLICAGALAVILLLVGIIVASKIGKLTKALKENAKAEEERQKNLPTPAPAPTHNCIINITSSDFSINDGKEVKFFKSAKAATISEEVFEYIDYAEQPAKAPQQQEPAPAPAPQEEPAKEEVAPQEEPTLDEVAPQEEPAMEEVAATEEDIEDGETVAFTSEKKTFEEKYAELSPEQKNYFDTIKKYAIEKEDARPIEAKGHLTVKFGKERLVRLQIRRDMVEAVFLLTDMNFKKYMRDQDTKIKEKPTVIRIENDAYLQLAIETVDLRYNVLVEEKNQRIEEQKAKKRERARRALEEKTSAEKENA